MRINKLIMREICQFREADFTFTPGLNIIVGRNGAGKSNLIKTIYGVLTNDWSRNVGGKDANVCQLSSAKARSWGALELSHDGVDVTIERSLAPKSGHFLRYANSEAVISGEAEVNSRVQALLGVSDWVVSELLFVAQGKTSSFLRETDSKRTKNFQELFGLTWLDELYKWLGAEAGGVIEMTDPKALEAELERISSELAVKAASVADVLTRRPDGDSRADRELLRQIGERARWKTEIETEQKVIHSAENTIAQLDLEIQALTPDVLALREAVQEDKELSDKARMVLGRLELTRKAKARRAEIMVKLRLAQEAEREPAPQRPAWVKADVDTQEMLSDARMRQRDRQRFLAKYDPKKGFGACPECGAPAEHLETRREYYLEQEAIWAPKIEELSSYSIARVEWVGRIADAQLTQANLKNELLQLADSSFDAELDEEALRGRIFSHDESSSALATLEKKLLVLERDRAHWSEQLQKSTKTWRRLDKQLAATTSLPAYEAVTARLEIRDAVDLELARQRGQLAALEDERERLNARLAGEKARWLDAAAQGDWMELCRQLRPFLAYDQLPKALLHACLTQLEPVIHEYLALFEAPFTATIQEKDLGILITKSDGVQHREARLSDAELLVLALATRLALAKLFTAPLGFLCLDEPTYGLDVDNRRALELVVERLRDYSLATGAQILLVTHEPGLAKKYDNKIDLGGGGL